MDPTSISLETNILLDLQMPAAASPVLRTGEDAEDTYYCRIVVGAYQNNRLAEQTVVYEDLPTTNRLQTKVRMDLHLHDLVELKKPHPCGSTRWEILRVGMDIKLRCLGCGHELMLPRSKAEKSIRKILTKEETS